MPAADTALKSQSKTALAKRVTSLSNRINREKRAAEEVGERVAGVLASGVALATATSIGFVEGRFSNKDDSPLSVGPVPLPLAVAAGTSLIGLATGSRWAEAATSGAVGAWGYGLGLAHGQKSRTSKAKKVSGIGDELMDAEMAEHYFGD